MTGQGEGLTSGSRHERVIIDELTRSRIVQYAGASGDYNPIHSDEVYAAGAAGLPGVFGHGMLTMGALAGFLQELVGVGSLTSIRVRFVERVWPGDTLVAHVDVGPVHSSVEGTSVELTAVVRNQNSVEVLRGSASALLPSSAAEPAAEALTHQETSHA